MAKHFCKEHKLPFFKKGKMKNFAHPLLDDEGEDTGEWCNEPEDTESKEAPSGSGEMTKGEWAEKERLHTASIEAQVAYKGVPALVEASQKFPDDALVKIARNWAMEKLNIDGSRTKALVEQVISENTGQAPTESTGEGEQFPPLKNVGQLFSRCLAIGVDRNKAMQIVGVTDLKEITDLDQAWRVINASV